MPLISLILLAILIAQVGFWDELGAILGAVAMVTRDLVRDLLSTGRIDLASVEKQPLVVPDGASVLRVVAQIRAAPIQMAIVADEFGAIEGVVTPTDILEAIVGELPDDREDSLEPREQPDGSLLVDAAVDIRRISQVLGIDLVDEADRYATLAGFLLHHLGRLPAAGTIFDAGNEVRFEVVETQDRRIGQVRILRAWPSNEAMPGGSAQVPAEATTS